MIVDRFIAEYFISSDESLIHAGMMAGQLEAHIRNHFPESNDYDFGCDITPDTSRGEFTGRIRLTIATDAYDEAEVALREASRIFGNSTMLLDRSVALENEADVLSFESGAAISEAERWFYETAFYAEVDFPYHRDEEESFIREHGLAGYYGLDDQQDQ